MPQKSRYAVDEKVRLIQEYLEGKLSPSEFERTYGSHQRVLRKHRRIGKNTSRNGGTGIINDKNVE